MRLLKKVKLKYWFQDIAIILIKKLIGISSKICKTKKKLMSQKSIIHLKREMQGNKNPLLKHRFQNSRGRNISRKLIFPHSISIIEFTTDRLLRIRS